ncbi:flagellar basal body P-ring formation chaperone FlgA [Candidatus Bealeia paramacronuclearis]|uniref:flagellar basal body P-ring formation chaperone FlgA n=1 Tax=Candidatus Bealeia paramacronuclearis TaxID=1921001 RepID=UPI0030CE6A97
MAFEKTFEMTIWRSFLRVIFISLLLNIPTLFADEPPAPEEIVLKTIREQYNESEAQKDVIMTLEKELPESLLTITSPQEIQVDEFTLNGNRFLALLKVKNESYEIKGKIEDVLMMPVANRVIKPGEIIAEEDLDLKEIPESALKNYMVTDAKDLIGFTPKGRPLVPEQFIKTSQIGKNKDVHKGELVTLQYKSGSLSISGKGKALEDGSLGDMVRVMNPQSKREVQGIVTGTNEVSLGG